MSARTFRPILMALLVASAACEGQKAPPPPPVPTSIKLELPSRTCREGSTLAVTTTVLDGDGGIMAAKPTLTIDPPSILEADGSTLRCAKEGAARIRASVGTAGAVEAVTVTSPLVGRWRRVDDDKAGLELEVVQVGEQLNAHVVRAPTEAALPAIKKVYPNTASNVLVCVQKVWSPGTKKWKGITRIGPSKWSLSDLAKDVTLPCTEGASRWLDDWELTLPTSEEAEVRSSTASRKVSVQRWRRVSPNEADGGGT